MSGGEPRANSPHDLPDAAELIDVVRTYLAEDLGPRCEGRDRWLVRIAANALTIAGRELRSGRDDAAAHRERLAILGVGDDIELAHAIRTDTLDAETAEVFEVLWATTLDKLAVANPDYRDESQES